MLTRTQRPRPLTAAERSHRLGRIRRLIALTPDWERWFSIDLEHLTVHVVF
jgi:hypothetical protein